MRLHTEAQDRNERLAAVAPTVLEALSALGKRSFFPKGIPFQSGQAKDCRINATIGQITDGAGNPIPLAPMAEKLAALPTKDVFLYTPIQGRDQSRNAWHKKLVEEDGRMASVGLGQVAAGICHAISMGADLFFDDGGAIVLPDLHWDNYDQIFDVRLNAKMVAYPFYGEDGAFNREGLRQALTSVSGKVHTILNFPSNPTGFSPAPDDMAKIAEILIEVARDRIVVVFCDDAYHGLVYEKTAATKSLFFELIEKHPNLIPLKCDGITKELSFFGGRVSFLHFGVAKEASDVLVDKCKGLIRAGIGGTVSISQVLLETELADPRHAAEMERVRLILDERYQALKHALSKPSRHWKVLPFNSGCFCLLELRDGIDAEALRQKLIKEESVGIVSQGQKYIRLAFCSMRKEDIAPLVEALERICDGI
ncbi:MAG: aminotransferase class I/II-fold pyridoxal phosphate-dependent enzyme [Holophagales bacterium]|jgi:aspartate/methionine/tyrosine aminotransferase|nr:aminotransferase class I/II-fold pyridoxal phosphate-dependent enzyme [Holophagales bacterium]